MSMLLFIAMLAPFWACVTAHAEEFDSAGVRIHYTTTGQGDPVILVHGLYSSAKMNWELPGITAAIVKSHLVIAPDCRGHGQSDKPEAEEQHGVPVTLIAGERDPCRRLYIEPLRRVRPDWPDHVIADAGHLNCIMKAEFKEQLLAALQASPPPPLSAPAKTP